MSRLVFLFGLDLIVAKEEILPAIAKRINLDDKMKELEAETIQGNMPFKQSFLHKADPLKSISVSEIQDIVADISLNRDLVDFIRRNSDRCYIVTSNINVWIEKLLNKIGMDKNIYCSKALMNKEGYIQDIVSIVDKGTIVRQMVMPFVAVGNGNNDAEMIEQAEIGVGFGGYYSIAASVLECASHAVYEEGRLVRFLEKLL